MNALMSIYRLRSVCMAHSYRAPRGVPAITLVKSVHINCRKTGSLEFVTRGQGRAVHFEVGLITPPGRGFVRRVLIRLLSRRVAPQGSVAQKSEQRLVEFLGVFQVRDVAALRYYHH